ncbi:hypothetical protein AAGW05_16725 [Arthrobacter sp. LAPM80]|uniref:hypothetical protein n=1 Tax=Arthrobacter sp. LAPM80 TaxID=3141788 RepID=UPI00398B059B
MSRSEHAAAFLHQTANDPALTTNALAVAAVMADTITGYRPVAVTNWRKVWQASGLLRGETLDAVAELIAARHIGQRQDAWNQTPGYPIRLHAGVLA